MSSHKKQNCYKSAKLNRNAEGKFVGKDSATRKKPEGPEAESNVSELGLADIEDVPVYSIRDMLSRHAEHIAVLSHYSEVAKRAIRVSARVNWMCGFLVGVCVTAATGVGCWLVFFR